MAADKEGYYINGGWWRAYMEKYAMDNDTKSVVIGIAGMFPDKHPFRAYKGYLQSEMFAEDQIQKYKELPENCRINLKDTKLVITGSQKAIHLYSGGGKIVAVDRQIVEMIDRKTANQTEDDFPDSPILADDGVEIVWCNDTTIFSCGRIETSEEHGQELLKYLAAFNF